MRALLIATVFLLAACAQPPPSTSPSPSATHDPATLNVTALLDLSGPRLPSGAPQRDALQLWADQHVSTVPRLRLRIVDVASVRSRAIIELRRAIVDEHADAVIVGVPVDYDEALATAVELARVPVLFTLPVPDPGRGWGFALAPTPAQLAKAELDDAAGRIVLASTMVVSDESASAVPERAAVVADLTGRGVSPTVMKVTPADGAKLRAALPTATVAVFAGPAKAYLDAVRGATAPTYLYFSYLSDAADIGDLREAASLAVWPGSRWIAGASVTTDPARLAFTQTVGARAGPPSTAAASAFDALGMVSASAERTVDPTAMRDGLETRSYAGIATTYSFTGARHAGFASADIVMLRYTGTRVAPAVR
jgi:hypothetical protein